MSNQIIIKIRPISAPRPRVYGKVTMMPPKYESYKEIIALQCRSFKKLEGNISVSLGFYFKLPKRLVKGKDYSNPIGDVDNLSKSILDALEGVAYYNDRQVLDLHITKRYANEDAVSIKIIEHDIICDEFN